MNLFDPTIAKHIEVLLAAALKNRLKGQGHVASGKGLNSIKVDVLPSGDDLVINIIGEDYLLYQDTGRKPGTWPNIGALEKWVRQKGLASEMKEVKKIAFLIGRNMKRIGMHSKGNRIDKSKSKGITGTIEKQEGRIQQLLFEMFEKNFELLVSSAAKEIGGKYEMNL